MHPTQAWLYGWLPAPAVVLAALRSINIENETRGIEPSGATCLILAAAIRFLL